MPETISILRLIPFERFRFLRANLVNVVRRYREQFEIVGGFLIAFWAALVMLISLSVLFYTLYRQPHHFVVGKDGQADFRTVSEAVDAAPHFSTDPFYIHILAGRYEENVRVWKNKTNLVFVGKGMSVTTLSSNRSEADGFLADKTATLFVEGDGFVATYMTIQNTAAPGKGYALAVNNMSPRSAFYRVGLSSYQGTLNANKGLQYYRECDIHGAVDVVLGKASATFPNCTLNVQPPLLGDDVVLTAQGGRNRTSGFVFPNATITSQGSIPKGTKVYLGRALGTYSRVMFIWSYLPEFVSLEGWMVGPAKVPVPKVDYGEYGNEGPAANMKKRLGLPGIRSLSSQEASEFASVDFVRGHEWLPTIGVPPIVLDDLD